MRKLLIFISATILCASFCACGQLDLGEGDKDSSSENTEKDSVSSKELISVETALKGQLGDEVNVIGYYAGYVKGTKLSDACFPYDLEEYDSNTNLLLSDAPFGYVETLCIPIALPVGQIREELNLHDNPEMFHQRIVVRGILTTYFKVNGIRNPISWRLATSLDTPNDTISEEHEEGTDSIEPVPVVVSFPRLLPQAMPVTRGR